MAAKRRLSEATGRIASFFSEDASGSPVAKWVGGIIIPASIAAYSVRCLMMRTGTIIGRGGALRVSGVDAIVYGIAILGLAVFLNAHFFFSTSRKLYVVSELGRPLGLMLLAGGALYLVFRVIVLG